MLFFNIIEGIIFSIIIMTNSSCSLLDDWMYIKKTVFCYSIKNPHRNRIFVVKGECVSITIGCSIQNQETEHVRSSTTTDGRRRLRKRPMGRDRWMEQIRETRGIILSCLGDFQSPPPSFLHTCNSTSF